MLLKYDWDNYNSRKLIQVEQSHEMYNNTCRLAKISGTREMLIKEEIFTFMLC